MIVRIKGLGNRNSRQIIMIRMIRNRHSPSLLKLQNTLLASLISSDSSQFSKSLRPFSISAQFAENAEQKIGTFTEPLSVFFKRSVVAPGESDDSHTQTQDSSSENARLKEKLHKLEEEIRDLSKKRPEKAEELKVSSEKGDSNKPKSANGNLWKLFADKKEKTKKVKVAERTDDFGHENPMVHNELSADMQVFARHLYVQGYFKNANFLPKNKFDVTCFESSFAREYLKYAALNLGKDHQEVSKWLSAKDLKKVALFGCPSLGEKSVYAAKHMRRFFEIDEQQVCQKCTLKESCKHANKRSKKASTKILDFSSVTRVLSMYAMESVPQKLVVPQEIKDSVSRLLKEIVSLTQITSSAVESSKDGG